MSNYAYPLDTTGSAVTNKVTGERQTLSPPSDSRDYHFVLTKSGPYYRDTLKIIHESTGRELLENLDWTPGHLFSLASYETEYIKGGIYQTIVFLDRTLSGTILLQEYQVLGGEWSLDENRVLEILSNRLHDPRQYTYESVSNKPETFPSLNHQHPADDMVGQRELVEATMLVAQAIRDRTDQLPPEIMAIMLNYYDKATLDSMLADLASSLIEDVAGPELNRIVLESIEDILNDYVLLNAYTIALDAIHLDIENIKATQNTQSSTLNSLNQSIVVLSNAISNIVSTTTLEERLLEFGEEYVTEETFNQYSNENNQLMESLEESVLTASEAMADIIFNLTGYVKKSELLSLLPDIVVPENQTVPIEVDTVSVATGLVSGILPLTIVAHSLRNGFISSLTLKTDNDQFLQLHANQEGGFGLRKRVQIVESQHHWDFIANWQEDGYTSENNALEEKTAGITPFHPIQYAIYATIDYVTVISEGTYRTNLRLEKIENGGVDPAGVITEYKKRVPHPTNNESLLVGIIGLTPAGQITLKRMVNKHDISLVETKTKILTLSEMETMSTVDIDFRSDFGHNSTSALQGVKMFDPDGVLMGVSGYYHEFKPCTFNKVTVLKPSIDISSFGPSATVRLEVTVLTETK